MPCNGCNDKPRQANPAVFRPATPKVWLGARYAAEVASRGPDFDALVKTKAQQSGVDGAAIWIVETGWLDHCRALHPGAVSQVVASVTPGASPSA